MNDENTTLNLTCYSNPNDSLVINYHGGELFLVELLDNRNIVGNMLLPMESARKLRDFLNEKLG